MSRTAASSRPRWSAKRSHTSLAAVVVLAAGLVTSVALAPPAGAAGTATVTYVAQGGGDSGTCEASPCGTVSYALTQVAANGEIRVSGQINDHANVTIPVTITGEYAPPESPAVIDGTNNGRPLLISGAGPVHLESLAIRNGSGDNGGGIKSTSGNLTLTQVEVRYNNASASGGGIYHSGNGALTIVESRIADNQSHSTNAFGGGGIYKTGGGAMTVIGSSLGSNYAAGSQGGAMMTQGGTVNIRSSLLDGGYAKYAGAILNDGSIMTITASTISDNRGTTSLGGIFANGPTTVVASTIVRNTSEINPGSAFVANPGEVVTIAGSIVAQNAGTTCRTGPNTGTYVSLGYNLTDDLEGSCSLSQPTDIVGADPGIDYLQLNGGPTATYMPTGSAALDVIPAHTTLGDVSLCFGADQRGYARPQPGKSRCAVGAVEPGFEWAYEPTFTSPASVAVVAGVPFSIPVRAEGTPTPTLSLAADYSVPPGMTFADNGDGSGTLSGSSATVTREIIPLVADNGLSSKPTQSLALEVQSSYVSVSDTEVVEGNSGTKTATFTVTRYGNTTAAASVKVSTANVTAAAGSDFTALVSAPVSFAANETTKLVTVSVNGDAVVEPNETFYLNLSAATGATISDATGTATIVDDDAKDTYLSVTDVSVTEGAAGATATATVTVTRSGSLAAVTTATASTANGTATAGTDYTATTAPLKFLATETTKTVSVPVIGDAATEADETININLTAVAGAVLSDNKGVATIVNDDGPSYLQVGDISANEGFSGTSNVTLRISRTGNLNVESTVTYATANGTATGTDFTAIPATPVTFAPNETVKTVSLSVMGDALTEGDETLKFNLSAPVNAVLMDASATVTIRNDDGPTWISIDDMSVTEGNSGTKTATFTLTRSGNLAGASSVKVTSNDGTAIKSADYTAVSKTVSWAATIATATVAVTITGDTVSEANETFTLDLTAPVGAVLSDAQAIGTILNDDGAVTPGPTTFVSVNDVWLKEANGAVSATFLLTRTGDINGSSTVTYATADGTATAASDYTAKPATAITFKAQQKILLVTVSILGDTVVEGNEAFSLVLSAPSNAVIADGSGSASIINDDFAYLTMKDFSLTEGASGVKAFQFTIARTGAIGGTATVNAATASGTAIAPSDYTVRTTTPITFVANQGSASFVVNVNGDLVPEGNETFTANLSAAVGADISDASAAATIANDDAASYLSINDVTVSEGAGAATFTITRSGNVGAAASVTAATASSSATAGSDFTAKVVSAAFAAGTTTQTLTVAINVTSDSLDEVNEKFLLNLGSAVGATITDSSGVATIVDDDAPTYLSVGDVSVVEGDTATFTVTRSGNLAGSTTVTAGSQEGTAEMGIDYGDDPPTTVTFVAGESTKTVSFYVADDGYYEPDNETFFLNLSAPVGAALSDATATATIVAKTSVALYTASYVATPPTAWQANLAQSFNVTVTNTGNRPWSKDGADKIQLGAHFATGPGTCCTWLTDQRFDLPSDVAPNASVTVTVSARAPFSAGNRVLELRMIRGSTAWFVENQATNVTITIPTAVTSATYSVPLGVPPIWRANEGKTFDVTVTNTGNQTWNAIGPNEVRLGVHFAYSAGTCCTWLTDQRWNMPHDILPGESVTIRLLGVTPPTFAAGDVVFEIQLVKEYTFWFDQRHDTNVTIA